MGARGRPPSPNHKGWRIPHAITPCRLLCAPRSAGTHHPAAACVSSAAQGEVCLRVSTGNGGRPATRAPQARRPPPPHHPGARRGRGRGAPRFRAVPAFWDRQREPARPTLDPGCLSLELCVGAGALRRSRAGIQGGWKARPRGDSGKPLPSGDIEAARPPGPLPRLGERGGRRSQM